MGASAERWCSCETKRGVRQVAEPEASSAMSLQSPGMNAISLQRKWRWCSAWIWHQAARPLVVVAPRYCRTVLGCCPSGWRP
jgi:hypothetical protein